MRFSRATRCPAGGMAGTGNTPEFYEGHHHLPPLVDGQGTKTTLELHTSLFFEGHPFALTSDDIRDRAEKVTVHGRTVLVPSVHDQLLHLCLHFAWSHMMATGAWRAFRDLDALLRTERVDWKEFTKLAKETRGGSACYWTFRLARTLAGISVPVWVERALAPPEPEFALRRLEQHFTYDLLPTENISPSLWLTYTMWRAGLRPRWSGHGRVRPWDRADELLAAERPGRARAAHAASQERERAGRDTRDWCCSGRSARSRAALRAAPPLPFTDTESRSPTVSPVRLRRVVTRAR